MALDPASIPVQAQPISGSLDFGNNPGNDYNSAYTNALNLNKQNYANILQGFSSTAAAQAAGAQGILAGYGNLSSDITSQIQGTDASQRQALTDQYMAESGKQSQGLISRGLGNTTVANSVQRGLTLDDAKANVQLSNQMAQLIANYQASIGQAGLNYASQANSQKTALSLEQLKMMERVNSPYPDANKYSQLAMQKGMLQKGGMGMGMGAGAGGGMAGGYSGRTTPGHQVSNNLPGGGRHLTPQTEVRQPALNVPSGRSRSQTLGEDQFGPGYESTSGDYAGWAEQDQSAGAEGGEDFGQFDGADYQFGNDQGDQQGGEDYGQFDGADYNFGDAGQDQADEDPYGGFYDNYQYEAGDDGNHYYTYDDGSYDTYDSDGGYQGYYGSDDSFQGDDWYD